MFRCPLCHHDVPLDDVAIQGSAGQCLACVRCYTAAVTGPLVPARTVQRELDAIERADDLDRPTYTPTPPEFDDGLQAT